MATFELNHEQAFSCSIFLQNPKVLRAHMNADSLLFGKHTLYWEQAREALLAYKKKWVLVEREDLKQIIEAHNSGNCGNYIAAEAEKFEQILKNDNHEPRFYL